MSLAPALSREEFASLKKLGSRLVLDAPIPPGHLLKLVGLRYVETIQRHYEVTSTGRFRIARGS
jgi:hypothetical protein